MSWPWVFGAVLGCLVIVGWVIFFPAQLTSNVQTVTLVAVSSITVNNPPSQIDNVSVQSGNLILLIGQSDKSENGVYKAVQVSEWQKIFTPQQDTVFVVVAGTSYAKTSFLYVSASDSYIQYGSTGDATENPTFGNITCDTINGTQLQSLQPNITGIGTQSQMLNMGNQRILALAAPTLASDAVNKEYMDNFAQGITWRAAVEVATSEVLPGVVTYDNGSNGVGATLTGTTALGTVNSYSAWVDGVTRILIQNEVNAIHNGVYVVTQNANPFVLTRATDFDGDPLNETKVGTGVFVNNSAYSGNRYVIGTLQSNLTEPPNVKIGVDNMTFVLFSGPENEPRECTVSYIVAANVGGGTINSGSWVTRPLNTVDDAGNLGVTLLANTITVPPGKYQIYYMAVLHGTVNTGTRLRDTTNNLDLDQQGAYNTDFSESLITNTITYQFDADTDLQLQSQVSTTKASTGMGVQNPYGPARFSEVKFTRLS